VNAPLNYLTSAGTRADRVLPLTWLTLVISVAVCIIIGALLWLALRRIRVSGGAAETRATAVMSGPDGMPWIRVGLLISAAPLLAALVWTMVALAEVGGPPPHPDLTLAVSAHQWWWEVQYDAENPQLQFSTANEIHIPVGAKVLVRLTGADVIHSFWVPQLSGKTDTIPGQTNLSWKEARVPGRYRGQCGEFCGFQHARMSLEVVAESAADFQRWRARQLQDAALPTTPRQLRGAALVEYRCGLCHAIRGSLAGARSAPDLTHLMSRRMIAAGTIVNSPANLAEWVQHPQSVKPGNLMPDQDLTAQQLADVQSYLELLN